MLKALERNIASVDERFVLLAPSAASVSPFFRNVDSDGDRHAEILRSVQRFRGDIYLHDGAITARDISVDGRHQTVEDHNGWHILLVDGRQNIKACALYLEYENSIAVETLRVRHCPLAHDERWRSTLWRAVRSEIARARREDLKYVELGGWAVARDSRRTSGPLTMALAVYGFSRRSGGALGMTTATFRHCSTVILQRLGGSRFEIDGVTLPPYFDARYNCMMEMLRFDSRRPNAKYVELIDRLRDKLADVLVVTPPATPGLASRYDHVSLETSVQPMFAA